MAVSKRLRYEVLRRDDFTCRYCGGAAPDVELTIDHVTPKALGGADTPDNLVACCKDCNAGKSSATADANTVAQVAEDALRWSAAMRQALSEMARRERLEIEAFSIVESQWDAWESGLPMPADWQDSVRVIVRAGLPLDSLAVFVNLAMGRCRTAGAVWKYFCGCCWRQIEDLQRRAAEILREGN